MFYLPTSLYPRRIPSDVIPSRSPQETRLATGMSCRNEGWLYLQGTAFSETKETNLMSRRVFRILVGWWWHGIILPNILVYIHNLTTIHHRKLRAWSTAHLKWDILEKGWIQQHKWQLKGICCMICWTQIATVTGICFGQDDSNQSIGLTSEHVDETSTCGDSSRHNRTTIKKRIEDKHYGLYPRGHGDS